MSVPKARIVEQARILDLTRCGIFSTTFNPTRIRTGNKILRQRLRGPSLVSYYPKLEFTLREFKDEFAKLDLEMIDEEEDDRDEHLEGLKFRGKNAPKKKRAPPGMSALSESPLFEDALKLTWLYYRGEDKAEKFSILPVILEMVIPMVLRFYQ
ncbi:mitochondral 37S ribosomal protein S27 [Zalerion maritima]|uniref:Small ribosomal subunit protein mS33 n=1 Tax=Zalerion maritima TaxID=339359 RepID=A0AAD5RSS8_9PEZI|nr:mitochondral 37S ribosomal protein S27 [Zalerion maritima]